MSRDCEHGQLARSCEVCELKAEIERLEGIIYDDYMAGTSASGPAFIAIQDEGYRIAKKREGR